MEKCCDSTSVKSDRHLEVLATQLEVTRMCVMQLYTDVVCLVELYLGKDAAKDLQEKLEPLATTETPCVYSKLENEIMEIRNLAAAISGGIHNL